MPDISISSDGREPVADFAQKVDVGERLGASTMWIACHLFERDPITLAAHALARTKSLKVTLMAVSPYTMHPAIAAMAAATLNELHPGRVSLCLGAGAPADLRAIDRPADKPVRVLREAIELVRALFSGENITYHGEAFSVSGRRLFAGASIPIILAASGPQMLELAGRCADGVLLSAGTSPEFIRTSLDQVRRGAKGRNITAHALAYGATGEPETAAHDQLRRVLAILLRGAHHTRNLELAGNRLDQSALDAAVTAGDWSSAEALITDDIVRHHAISGTAAQIQDRLALYHNVGLDEVVIAGTRNSEQLSSLLHAAKSFGDH